jgi:glycosyltransferase involved in cell wall biosynthesis
MNQTYPNIECILIDDASPDNSIFIAQQLISSYQGKIVFTIISNEKNQGVSVARNQGIAVAHGQYVYLLDGDDELPAEALALLATTGERYDADLVLGEVRVVGTSRSPVPPMHITKETCWEDQAVFASFLKKKWYDMAGNKLIKKSVLNGWSQPFTPGTMHGEDTLFSFQLASKCRSVVVIPEMTYYYHIHSTSVTQQKTKKNIESIYSVIRAMLTYSQQEKLFDNFAELPAYFEKQRVYFIKSLLRGHFEKKYIKEQRNKINTFYRSSVWKGKPRNLEFILKDFVLLLWICIKK